MKSTIDVRIEFSFKGENYAPSATIDLDGAMASGLDTIDVHRILASRSGIDTYSYLYEVMESYEPSFCNASGLAVDYLDGEQFDLAGFRAAWQAAHTLERLRPIARDHLAVDNLEQNPALRDALLAAYRLGLEQGRRQASD